MRRNVLLWIAGIIVALGAFNAVQTGINSLKKQQSEIVITTESKMTTGKNSFMSTCVGANQSFLSAEQLNNFCGCAWNKIVEMYGDKIVTDLTIAERIAKSGYTQAETDKLMKCLEPYLE